MKIGRSDIVNILDMLKIAGSSIMDLYRLDLSELGTSYKKDDSPVTLADLRANKIICAYLKKAYPKIPIISEETKLAPYEDRMNWKYVWLVDPLDGTKEFMKKTDEFSINVALIEDGKAVAGFIYLPVFHTWYFAIKGSGAYEKNRNGEIRQIKSSSFSLSREGVRIVASRNHKDEQTQTFIQKFKSPTLIELGSALKFISIAKGDADYYPRMIHIMEWDTAAGQIIIEEAGGSLTDAISGLPLVYNKPFVTNPYFIAMGKIES